MLIIDGAKFEPWTPPSEQAFAEQVTGHVADIFGEGCVWFPVGASISSQAGTGVAPDGYVIDFLARRSYAVELELASHPLQHISFQVDRILQALKNISSQNKIVETIYAQISNNPILAATIRSKIGPADLHKFLYDLLVNQSPSVIVIVDEANDALRENLVQKQPKVDIVEFCTLQRGRVGLEVHAHLFEPLFKPVVVTTPKQREGAPLPDHRIMEMEILGKKPQIEVILPGGALSWRKYHLIPFGSKNRAFFPGFKIDFKIETDIGEFTTRVTSAAGRPPLGDAKAGAYIQKNMKPWFDMYPQLKPGDKLIITAVEPGKRYKLSIAPSAGTE